MLLNRPDTFKIASLRVEIWTPSNTWFLWPTQDDIIHYVESRSSPFKISDFLWFIEALVSRRRRSGDNEHRRLYISDSLLYID